MIKGNGGDAYFRARLRKNILRNSSEGQLTFTTNIEEVNDKPEIIFLALPRSTDTDGSAELKYILDVADHSGKISNEYKVIVNMSTYMWVNSIKNSQPIHF